MACALLGVGNGPGAQVGVELGVGHAGDGRWAPLSAAASRHHRSEVKLDLAQQLLAWATVASTLLRFFQGV